MRRLGSLAATAGALALLQSHPVVPVAEPASAQTERPTAPSGDYRLDKSHASLVWKIDHWGLSRYTARFTRFDAQLQLDSAAPERSTLAVTIDPASVETDYPGPGDFDQELRGSRFLDSTGHPEIRFRSARVERTGPATARIVGELTFRGQTRPFAMDATLNGAMASHPMTGRAAVGFSARGVLKRSEWGLSTFLDHLSDEVEIIVEAEFIGPPVTARPT